MSEAAPVEAPVADAPAPEAPETANAAPEGSQATPGALPESGSGPGSAAKRLFKISVDGQEEEVPEDKVPERLQKAKFHEKRSQELARRQAAFDKALAAAQENPEEGFEDLAKILGLDAKKLSEDRLMRELQRQIEEDELAALSPEQRQARQEKAELEKYRAERKAAETAAKQAAEEAKQAEMQKGFETTLDKAIEYGMKGTKLEGDPWAQFQFASLVAGLAQDVMDGKLEDLPNPKQIAQYVEKELARVAGKFAPPPPPAPTKPTHPQANRPARDSQPRDPKTGQFKPDPGQYSNAKGFKHNGMEILRQVAERAAKGKK